MFGNPPAPVLPNMEDPCFMLQQLRQSLYALMSGQVLSQTRHGEKWSTYSRGDVPALKQEIRRLEQLCGLQYGRGQSVRTGPGYRPNGSFGVVGRYGGLTRYPNPWGGWS